VSIGGVVVTAVSLCCGDGVHVNLFSGGGGARGKSSRYVLKSVAKLRREFKNVKIFRCFRKQATTEVASRSLTQPTP